MTNLYSILKSRDITLPTKVLLVKAMVFPVVMYGCESWTMKKAERQRIDAFELWCWRRLLRVPWPARRSNQSILEEISPGCSLEGLMLKLKLQYFGHMMWRAGSLEKTLMLGLGAGREGDDGGWEGFMASPTQWTRVWVNSGSWWWTERPGVLWFIGLQSWRWLSDWPELNRQDHCSVYFKPAPTSSPYQIPSGWVLQIPLKSSWGSIRVETPTKQPQWWHGDWSSPLCSLFPLEELEA